MLAALSRAGHIRTLATVVPPTLELTAQIICA
jgi:hypothetical protein